MLSKAERLEQMTDPFGPDFPLDEDILAELDEHPGELPTSAEHYIDLLSDPPVGLPPPAPPRRPR